jgi:hypothetical protein
LPMSASTLEITTSALVTSIPSLAAPHVQRCTVAFPPNRYW